MKLVGDKGLTDPIRQWQRGIPALTPSRSLGTRLFPQPRLARSTARAGSEQVPVSGESQHPDFPCKPQGGGRGDSGPTLANMPQGTRALRFMLQPWPLSARRQWEKETDDFSGNMPCLYVCAECWQGKARPRNVRRETRPTTHAQDLFLKGHKTLAAGQVPGRPPPATLRAVPQCRGMGGYHQRSGRLSCGLRGQPPKDWKGWVPGSALLACCSSFSS